MDFSIPTVFDPSLAPEGYHVVHAYTAACDDFDEWERFLPEGKESGKVGKMPNSISATTYSKEQGYTKLREEKEEVLWKAIERVIPDVRNRAKRKGSVVLTGTPLTHRRYNQRFRGTYGPSPGPGKDVWELPGPTTKIEGLLACGDTTFPGEPFYLKSIAEQIYCRLCSLTLFIPYTGIGLPGVAASGTIAANTLTTVRAQLKLIKELKEMGALQ
jgi:phytoene dehydrogenase-like protein